MLKKNTIQIYTNLYNRSIQMFFFFLLLLLLSFMCIKFKTENLIAKLKNPNQNFTFSWVSLIGISTTWPEGATLLGWPKYILLTINSGAPAAEGRQAEPHTHIREQKETHELIFSCVSWLAVLLVGAYARRRRRRRGRRWWSRATWRPCSS